MPFKSQYSVGEFLDELKQGTLWQAFAKANPKESAFLVEHAEKKINQEGDFIPIDFVKTHTGKAILWAILTLPARPVSR